MTIKAIIDSVRWALDEERGYEDYETKYMDRIIRSRVWDALRWVNLYADATLLNDGDSSESSSSTAEKSIKQGIDVSTMTYDTEEGTLTLPPNFVRLLRIRCEGWAKAVMTTIKEDSDEYMMQNDENYPESKATKERPMVALIESVPNMLQLFPHPDDPLKINITYATSPASASSYDASDATKDGTTNINIPDKVKTAYIYYLAYLVMIAYNETSKASNMLATAKMNAGVSDK